MNGKLIQWSHSIERNTLATPNYGYEKRQKELAKKRKKEDKLKAKSEKRSDSPESINNENNTHEHHLLNTTSNFSNKSTSSYSNLCNTYDHPQYILGTNEAKKILAGSHCFQLSEIEVFEKE